MISSAWLGVAIALNTLYVGLMFAAIPNLKAEAKSSAWRWLRALTIWWPMDDSLYEDVPRIRRLRLVGFFVLLATIAAYVAAFRSVPGAAN